MKNALIAVVAVFAVIWYVNIGRLVHQADLQQRRRECVGHLEAEDRWPSVGAFMITTWPVDGFFQTVKMFIPNGALVCDRFDLPHGTPVHD